MVKFICLLMLAFAACMVAGLPHQDVNNMLHRTVRAAAPGPTTYRNPQYQNYDPYGQSNYGSFGSTQGFVQHLPYDGNSDVHLDEHCPHGRQSCHYDIHVQPKHRY